MNDVQRRIESLKASLESEKQNRDWQLRCDEVKKARLWQNWDLIKNALKTGFDQLQKAFPEIELGAQEIPSRAYEVRKSLFPKAAVNVDISPQGSLVTITETSYTEANDQKTFVDIRVRDDSTYFSVDDQEVSTEEIADLILKPLIDAIEKEKRRR